MLNLFKLINQNKPKLRELDPTTAQRIKEGSFVVKIISETEVATRKCNFYAGNCTDQEIANYFREEAEKLQKAKLLFQDYYEAMTKE